MTRCEVLLPAVGEQLDTISEMIGRLDARARIPQIEVAADDRHVQLVFRHLDPLSQRDLDTLTEFARASGFHVRLQPAGPDSVHSLYPETQSLEMRPVAQDPLRIAFDAVDFVQVNSDVNQQMVAQALRLLDLRADHRVLDLFCGLGNFTLPMARICERVTGVEGDRAMVERARGAARQNGIDNTEYHVADLDQPDRASPWVRRRYDRILLDPPRSGAQAIARMLPDFGASRVVYVSCQPSSLVRDAAIICAQGYRMTHVGVMDMFPQTAHVESMAVFSAA
jgi:23S rRNA (uracil1939-C5)-methyltransferase